MSTCNTVFTINNTQKICAKPEGHEGIHEDAFMQLFELAPGEREHLRRFLKFLRSSWSVKEPIYLDGSGNFATPDLLIEQYIEWLKRGEPT